MQNKRNYLSILRGTGPLVSFIIMTTGLLFLILLMRDTYASFPHLVSGKSFLNRFQYPSVPIHRWYISTAVSIAAAILCTLPARSLNHRKTPLAYWAFAIPTFFSYLYLAIIVTIPFNWLIQYINNMGFTAARIYGLFYGIGLYCIILIFLCWALRKPRTNNTSESLQKSTLPSYEEKSNIEKNGTLFEMQTQA